MSFIHTLVSNNKYFCNPTAYICFMITVPKFNGKLWVAFALENWLCIIIAISLLSVFASFYKCSCLVTTILNVNLLFNIIFQVTLVIALTTQYLALHADSYFIMKRYSAFNCSHRWQAFVFLLSIYEQKITKNWKPLL